MSIFDFNISFTEEGEHIIIHHLTLEDRLLLRKLYSNKIDLFFQNEIRSFFFTSYKLPYSLALELAYMLYGLFISIGKERYKTAFMNILKSTWLSQALTTMDEDVDVIKDSILESKMSVTLMPHQREYLNNYVKFKTKRKLRGLFLAFEQGLGKTITALSLSEYLPVEQSLIICPNAIKSVWKNELRKVVKRYSEDEQLWESDIYAHGISNPNMDISNCRYIIINFESIAKILPFIDKSKRKIIMVDESHLIKELNSGRTKMVLDLVKNYNFKDVVLQSGTPIKGYAHELLPILIINDTRFTPEALDIYKQFSSTDHENLLSIFRRRFEYLSFRKTKMQVNNTIKLPPKEEHTVMLRMPDVNKYRIDTVKADIRAYVKDLLDKEKPYIDDYREIVDSLANKYHSVNPFLSEGYSRYQVITGKIRNAEFINEEEKNFKRSYEKELISSMKNSKDRLAFRENLGRANNLYYSALGRSIGNVYMKRYRDMVIDIATVSIPEIKKIYENSLTKKVIIVSSFPEAIETCAENLRSNGFSVVTITGVTSEEDRAKNIQKFKEDDRCSFLLGTINILMVGFTLTHSDSLVFLNEPWRFIEAAQTQDRIHRIGQVNTAHIYTFLIEDSEKTISSRNNEIINNSKYIFDKIIGIDKYVVENK